MKRIFEHIGRAPPRLKFDDLSTAVVKVLEGGDRFQAEVCNPAPGNEKGNVENKVG